MFRVRPVLDYAAALKIVTSPSVIRCKAGYYGRKARTLFGLDRSFKIFIDQVSCQVSRGQHVK